MDDDQLDSLSKILTIISLSMKSYLSLPISVTNYSFHIFSLSLSFFTVSLGNPFLHPAIKYSFF